MVLACFPALLVHRDNEYAVADRKHRTKWKRYAPMLACFPALVAHTRSSCAAVDREHRQDWNTMSPARSARRKVCNNTCKIWFHSKALDRRWGTDTAAGSHRVPDKVPWQTTARSYNRTAAPSSSRSHNLDTETTAASCSTLAPPPGLSLFQPMAQT